MTSIRSRHEPDKPRGVSDDEFFELPDCGSVALMLVWECNRRAPGNGSGWRWRCRSFSDFEIPEMVQVRVKTEKARIDLAQMSQVSVEALENINGIDLHPCCMQHYSDDEGCTE